MIGLGSDIKKGTTDTEKGDFLKLSQDLQTEDVLVNIEAWYLSKF